MSARITDFLLARIAEDEKVARAAVGDGRRWWVDGPTKESGMWWVVGAFLKFPEKPAANHIARHDPAHILAECAAKRAIIDLHSGENDTRCQSWNGNFVDEPCETLRALASAYSDHPDYQQEWAA